MLRHHDEPAAGLLCKSFSLQYFFNPNQLILKVGCLLWRSMRIPHDENVAWPKAGPQFAFAGAEDVESLLQHVRFVY